MITGYNDLSRCFIWEWNEKVLGPLTFDAERTLTFDGVNFMVRRKGHPDDAVPGLKERKGATDSTSLIRWLEGKVMERDPNLLNDRKWTNRTLWHEYLRITKVKYFILKKSRRLVESFI